MRRFAGAGTLVGVVVALALPGHAAAAGASPSSVNFGNVPINTTVSQAVTITVDAGYRTEIASGSGINAPFGFDFDTCGAGGGFAGPGTCTVTERFTPTSVGSFSGNTTVFECPVAGGSCLPITFSVQGAGISLAAASPLECQLRQRPDQHDGEPGGDDHRRRGLPDRDRLRLGDQRPLRLRLRHLRRGRRVCRAGYVHRDRALHADQRRLLQRQHDRVRVPGRGR